MMVHRQRSALEGGASLSDALYAYFDAQGIEHDDEHDIKVEHGSQGFHNLGDDLAVNNVYHVR